jgi:hypothetical protein
MGISAGIFWTKFNKIHNLPTVNLKSPINKGQKHGDDYSNNHHHYKFLKPLLPGIAMSGVCAELIIIMY